VLFGVRRAQPQSSAQLLDNDRFRKLTRENPLAPNTPAVASHSVSDCIRPEPRQAAPAASITCSMRIRTYAIVAAGTAAVVSGIFAILGWLTDSDWSTFFPDLVVGIAGAGFISTVIAFVQQRASESADRRAEQTAAYLQLLDAITAVRGFRPGKDEDGLIARTTTSMIVFSETLDEDYPSVPAWFEAERQLLLYYANVAMMRWAALAAPVVDDARFKALEPVFQWTKEFSGNVRLWRRGKLSDHDAANQAVRIEEMLRAKHAWQPHPE
jgi:hypothetical protein